jgi:hypothetical protein
MKAAMLLCCGPALRRGKGYGTNALEKHEVSVLGEISTSISTSVDNLLNFGTDSLALSNPAGRSIAQQLRLGKQNFRDRFLHAIFPRLWKRQDSSLLISLLSQSNVSLSHTAEEKNSCRHVPPKGGLALARLCMTPLPRHPARRKARPSREPRAKRSAFDTRTWPRACGYLRPEATPGPASPASSIRLHLPPRPQMCYTSSVRWPRPIRSGVSWFMIHPVWAGCPRPSAIMTGRSP